MNPNINLEIKSVQKYIDNNCNDSLFSRLTFQKSCPEIIVVIPAYDEELKELKEVINSVMDNSGDIAHEIFVLINYGSSDKQNIKSKSTSLKKKLDAIFTQNHIHICINEFEAKKSGVGYARKLLMDTALLRLENSGRQGLIVNLDADTKVGTNYLKSIQEHFQTYKKCEAASIPFEHDLDDKKTSEAILNYELHLRYYINIQRHLGLPYAYQTVGSAMAVRSRAYAKEGGMNKRMAGEDFYFLQKYGKNRTLMDLSDTCVYPSSRRSSRVPFGTGKAVGTYIDENKNQATSYNPESFELLKQFIDYALEFMKNEEEKPVYRTAPAFSEFLNKYAWEKKLSEIKKNARGLKNRIKRFFQWFDAFLLMKYLHHMRDTIFPNLEIKMCLNKLAELIVITPQKDLIGYLKELRIYDENNDYWHQCKADLISKASKTSAS